MLIGLNTRAALNLEKDAEGYYLIGSPQDLVAFSNHVNDGNSDTWGRLTADIDMTGVDIFPIGLYADLAGTKIYYRGRFDGQGHVIKNLTIFREDNYEVGLFSRADGAIIENLGIVNATMTSTSTYTADGREEIGVRAGVIVGELGSAGIVRNCWTAGELSVTTNHPQAGYLVGETSGLATIVNCFTTGEVLAYQSTGSVSYIINSYAKAEVDELGATGELCFMLNGDQSKITWYQTLGEDALPTQDKTHKQVYGNGAKNCDGTPAGTITYSNTDDGSTIPPHEFDAEGYCANCGFEGFEVIPTLDGWYEVTTPEEMRWVSRFVNKGHQGIQIRLMNDLDMSSIPNFPPIGWYSDSSVEGKSNTAFNGIFQGNYHVISNLNIQVSDTQEAGFFSRISGGSGVRNLGIANATVVNDAGVRAGILGGEIHNTRVENCWTAGSLTVSTTHGQCMGFAGEAASTTLVNCWSTYEGGFVTTNSTTLTNCNYFGMNENIGLDAESGALCYKLNGNSFDPDVVTYYQNLEEDEYPTWDKTRGLVYPAGEEYKSAVTEEDYAELVTMLVDNEHAAYEDIMAPASLIDTYLERIDALKETPFAEFLPAYKNLQAMRDALAKAATAYEEYQKAVADIQAYVDANSDFFTGAERDLLISYLTTEAEPGEDFPNGSSQYILNNRNLNSNYVTAEISFAQDLLNNAIRHGYAPGADVTNLLENAIFANGTSGWETEGSFVYYGTGDAPTTKHLMRGGNQSFNVYQTVTELKNGLYEFRLGGYAEIDAGLLAGAYNYRNLIYANEQGNYQKPLYSDLLTAAEVEGVGGFEEKLDDYGESIGYKPNAVVGVARGVDLGHWDNRVIAQVTDGTLTVGLLGNPTYGLNNYDFFGNAHLRYLGEAEDAKAIEALNSLLADIDATATHILEDYYPDQLEYREAPNFYSGLKDELRQAVAGIASATTGAQKYALLSTFTDIFKRIYQSKQLYAEMRKLSDDLVDVYGEQGTDEQIVAIQQQVIDPIYDAFDTGGATDEQAQAFIDRILNDDLYLLSIGREPEQDEDGNYLIADPYNLIWFSRTVTGGRTNLNVTLTQDIDMSAIKNFAPIGLHSDSEISSAGPNNHFGGTFDGRGHVIKNLTIERWDGCEAGLFSRTQNATIKNLGIVNAKVTNVSVNGNAVRAGIIAGEAYRSTIVNCYTAGNLEVNTEHTNCCGIAGEAAEGSVRNCFTTYQGTAATSGTQVNVFNGYDIEEIAATGELCFKLNEGQETPVFFQTLGEDAYPVLDNTHKQVYAHGTLTCDGSLTEDATFDNVEGTNERAEHQFEDGVCTVCGFDMAAITEIVDGYYIIRTPYNLRWFSKYVNGRVDGQTHGGAKGRLEADIDMKDIDNFSPISYYSDFANEGGFPNVTYSGTFDGNYHIISNLHMEYNLRIEGGLFGRMVSGGVIKNLGMVNVSIKNTHTDGKRIGCIVGENNGGTIQNCYTAGEIVLESSHYQKAGLSGEASGGHHVNSYTTYDPLKYLGDIDNCYYGADVANMASTGELCYKLNRGVVNDPIWRQTIGVDPYPTFNQESGVVYLEGTTYTNETPALAAVEGSKEDPFVVKTTQDMLDLRKYLNKNQMNYIVLENDIDMAGVDEWIPFNNVAEDYPYWVSLNGQGHVIRNFAPKNETNYQSIIGILCGEVKYLGVENADVKCTATGTGIVAAWAGRSASFDTLTVVEHVYVTGKLECSGYTGGLIGNIGGPTKILNCYANVDIQSQSSVTGGVVGRIQAALDMENVYAAGSLNRGGGIVGGGKTATTPVSVFKNVAVWNNDFESFGETTATDRLSGLSFYNGQNFAELQQTVVAWDNKVWSCDMAEGSYPVLLFDPTGIEAVTTGNRLQTTGAVYDLSGRRIANEKLQKGIYIISGKKVLVK